MCCEAKNSDCQRINTGIASSLQLGNRRYRLTKHCQTQWRDTSPRDQPTQPHLLERPVIKHRQAKLSAYWYVPYMYTRRPFQQLPFRRMSRISWSNLALKHWERLRFWDAVTQSSPHFTASQVSCAGAACRNARAQGFGPP